MGADYDFAGWATRNNIKCADGRTIRRNAFEAQDGEIVPLVYGHGHEDIDDVLGHGILENRDEGVYFYGKFNNSSAGQKARECVENGDIRNLSIYANDLVQQGGDVVHGVIREVSLVLAGANRGAVIETPYIEHSDGIHENLVDEAVIYTGLDFEEIAVEHSADDNEGDDEENEYPEELEHSAEAAAKDDTDDRTIQDVVDSMNEEQKKVLYYLIGTAGEKLGEKDSDDESDEKKQPEEGGKEMKHNVFETDKPENTLSHDAVKAIMNDVKRYGNLKDSVLAHADTYGIKDIESLFPEPKDLNMPPEFLKRDTSWVSIVMSGVHHSPFSRIKSRFADIREDAARAKGYTKGALKKEEVFSLLKRETTPTTIYKKQKLDKDDITDITDFSVVAWIKAEMKVMLDEECARAILIGDGRLPSDEFKIKEENIRPIYKEHDLFSVKERYAISSEVAADEQKRAEAFIKQVRRTRKDYKGSGNPILFTTEDIVTDCLMLEDGFKREKYDTIDKLATALRVSKIVTVEVMEGLKRAVAGATFFCDGIMVNLSDYNVGTDKGGKTSFFEDFDIDYNQQKYLLEGRFSGALVKPFSALIFEHCIGSSVPEAAISISKKIKTLDNRNSAEDMIVSGSGAGADGFSGLDDDDEDPNG